jgi:transcriptional regulator with XRE-family HTH domain
MRRTAGGGIAPPTAANWLCEEAGAEPMPRSAPSARSQLPWETTSIYKRICCLGYQVWGHGCRCGTLGGSGVVPFWGAESPCILDMGQRDERLAALHRAALVHLRAARQWAQKELAAAAGARRQQIYAYESGRRLLTRRRLNDLAGLMGFGEQEIDLTLAFVQVVAAGLWDPDFEGGRGAGGEREGAPIARALEPATDEGLALRKAALRLGLEGAAAASQRMLQLARRRMAEAAVAEAAALWERLAGFGPRERLAMLDAEPEHWSWALAERLCRESEAEAANDPGATEEAVDAGVCRRHRRLFEGFGRSAGVCRLLGRCQVALRFGDEPSCDAVPPRPSRRSGGAPSRVPRPGAGAGQQDGSGACPLVERAHRGGAGEAGGRPGRLRAGAGRFHCPSHRQRRGWNWRSCIWRRAAPRRWRGSPKIC